MRIHPNSAKSGERSFFQKKVRVSISVSTADGSLETAELQSRQRDTVLSLEAEIIYGAGQAAKQMNRCCPVAWERESVGRTNAEPSVLCSF